MKAIKRHINFICINSETMNPEVTKKYESETRWKQEMKLLREIVLESWLEEELKWNQACYTLNGKNVLIVSSFKPHCALNFIKWSLIQDTENLLTKPWEHTQGGRQMRFTDIQEIQDNVQFIKKYIQESIEIEKSGKEIEFTKLSELEVPDELKEFFDNDPEFKIAFESLTLWRQKAYLMFIGAAKQSSTRTDRIKKYLPRILAWKWMHDCVCGHSQKMPSCDGSHKNFPDSRQI